MNVCRWSWVVVVVVIGVGLVRAVSDTPEFSPEVGQTTGKAVDDDPRYEGKELVLPDGYRTWVFVGANLGLRYRKDEATSTPREAERHTKDKIGDFHNVYINPKAYEHFKQTGRFPEGTVLVMDVYRAEGREPKNIVEGGYFPGDQRDIEVAVKDSKRPDGAKEEWAYYIFPSNKKKAAAMPKAACYDCHLKHASTDNVWVQFYPTLRDKK